MIRKFTFIIIVFVAGCLLTSCAGYRFGVHHEPYEKGSDKFFISCPTFKTGKENWVNSVEITINFNTLGNFTYHPDAFVIEVVCPENQKDVSSVIKKGGGLFWKTQSGSFEVKGENTVAAKIKLESKEKFNLDSIDIKILPSQFLMKDERAIITDTLTISSFRWAYK